MNRTKIVHTFGGGKIEAKNPVDDDCVCCLEQRRPVVNDEEESTWFWFSITFGSAFCSIFLGRFVSIRQNQSL